MFVKLYSDTTITKLKKVPQLLWYLFYGLSSMFASVFFLKQQGLDYIELANGLVSGMSASWMLIFFYPTLFIVNIVIFEIIAYFVNIVMLRRFPELAQSDFVFKLRLTEIIVLIAVGIISLIFFALPVIANTGSVVINSLFQAFMLGIFLYELTKEHARVPHNVYKYLATLYIGINLVLNTVSLVVLFTFPDTTVREYIDAAIKVGLYLLIAAFAYMQYKKLKQLPMKNDDITPPKDDKVFKDFGF